MENKNNYGEIVCTAIDEIISKRLEDLSYDISKVCTIVDDSSKKKGKYIVSDGAVKFEAYSTETDLCNGNSVMVTIPNGDYNMQKTITGRIAADDTTPFVYTSPLNNMIQITNNIFDREEALQTEGSLLANDVIEGSNVLGTTTPPLYSITAQDGEFAGFTRLGVSANFKTWVADMGAVEGTYGIVILVHYHKLVAPGQLSDIVDTRQYYFSSLDMIGNPYYFDSYFPQEKVFDISDINNIESIEVYFFQSGNFKDINGQLIPHKVFNEETGKEEKFLHNLFVNDVKIVLGYSMDAFEGETLLLSTPDGLSYHYDAGDRNRKEITLRWIHQIDDNHYEMYNNERLPVGHSIRWFKHNPGYKPPEGQELDKYAGKDWEPITNTYSPLRTNGSGIEMHNPGKLIFMPDTKKQQEIIRAIGVVSSESNLSTGVDDAGNEQIETTINEVHYNTKENLKFENEEYVPDAATYEAATALQIVCEDGSEGHYFIYNQNGKIINEGEGQGKQRYLKALYQGRELSDLSGKIDFIEWYFPDELTMLEVPDGWASEYGGFKKIEQLLRYSVDYKSITRTNVSGSTPFSRQAYSITNQWNYQNANNTVLCKVSINGVVYEAVAELTFGKAGTNGTNQTFLIAFENNANALNINSTTYDKQVEKENKAKQALEAAENDPTTTPQKLAELQAKYEDAKVSEITVEARLYDGNGSRIDFTGAQAKEIKWKWYSHSVKLNTDNEDAGYMELLGSHIGPTQTIRCKTYRIPADNYYILMAEYRDLQAYLPIPLKSKKVKYIEGAREVIYNHQGNPNYYSDPYILYYTDADNKTVRGDVTKITWGILCNESFAVEDKEMAEPIRLANANLNKSFIPTLKPLESRGTGYVGLSASPMYMSGFNDKVCVSTKMPTGQSHYNGLGWSQPLLIMQSRYDFAMLNEWDGSLQIDEETGSVMATMLGAGRKNADNTFSGVLIGDIGGGTDLDYAEKLTGVYGFHRGELSFGLKEDGRAFFGKKGHGQILIDGNDSSIKSAKYRDIHEGMIIDLDDGFIHISGEINDKVEGNPQAEVLISPFGDPKKLITPLDTDPDYNIASSYFRIKSNQGNTLMDIQNDKYFLQSNNWTDDLTTVGKGSYLDLDEGILDIKSPAGRVFISGGYETDNAKDLPYFNISVHKKEGWPEYYDHPLFYVDSKEYYLQSSTYGTIQPKPFLAKDNHFYNTHIVSASGAILQAMATGMEEIGENPDTHQKIYTYKEGNIGNGGKFDKNWEPSELTSQEFLIGLDDDNKVYNLQMDASKYIVQYKDDDEEKLFGYYLANEGFNTEDLQDWFKYYIEMIPTDVGVYQVQYIPIGGYHPEREEGSRYDADEHEKAILDKIRSLAKPYYYEDMSPPEGGVIKVYTVPNTIELTQPPSGSKYTDLQSYYNAYKEQYIHKGFRLDLKNNAIHGYDLSLKGISSLGKGSFLLDSSAIDTPFLIGNNFKVSWDGTLSCNKINTLNNDGQTDKVISINKNFYVSKSGGAGGSGCNFTGAFGGYCSGTGSFKAINTLGEGAFISGGFYVDAPAQTLNAGANTRRPVVEGSGDSSNSGESSDTGIKVDTLGDMKQAIIDLWNDLQSANGKIGKLASYCHDHDSEKTGTTNVVDGLSTTSSLGGGSVDIDGGLFDGAVTLYYGKATVLTDVGKVSKTDEVESAGAVAPEET